MKKNEWEKVRKKKKIEWIRNDKCEGKRNLNEWRNKVMCR